ncbi:MAG: hypothetical protein U9Q98_00535 [Bacteroidota bacterium]|nr:hypothetical protein [Bacteroidota bacterium]
MIAIIVIVTFAPAIYTQEVEFYGEDIHFTISESHFTVDGNYHFCNISTDSIRTPIMYPFPLDSLYGDVDNIRVVNLHSGGEVKFTNNSPFGIRFSLVLAPLAIAAYRIAYRQELNAGRAEYILTTTRHWNKPFEMVNYRLTILSDIKLDSCSYQPDSTAGKQYFWKKRNFMPQKNMLFWFSSR